MSVTEPASLPRAGNDGTAGDPAMMAWIRSVDGRLAAVPNRTALFALIDAMRGQMEWMRLHEPEHAATLDAAVQAAFARLPPIAAAPSPPVLLVGRTEKPAGRTEAATGSIVTRGGQVEGSHGPAKVEHHPSTATLRPTVALLGRTAPRWEA